MAETMTALEALQRFAELAPDSAFAKWWAGIDAVGRNGWCRATDVILELSAGPSELSAGIVAAVRALSARDASLGDTQIRREALVEGARWALKQVRKFREGAEIADFIDPAAILERETEK